MTFSDLERIHLDGDFAHHMWLDVQDDTVIEFGSEESFRKSIFTLKANVK